MKFPILKRFDSSIDAGPSARLYHVWEIAKAAYAIQDIDISEHVWRIDDHEGTLTVYWTSSNPPHPGMFVDIWNLCWEDGDTILHALPAPFRQRLGPSDLPKGHSNQ